LLTGLEKAGKFKVLAVAGWAMALGKEMTALRLATWNINSVRLRAPLVRRLLEQEGPDVLCLQETKCPNELFPAETFRELGYVHQAINGQKGYHGVAILSRLPFRKFRADAFCGKDDTRHVCAEFENGLELHNFYVPAGGDIPDIKANPKFAHKLDFLRELAEAFEKQRRRRNNPVVMVGDLNVAPFEHDVWSHKQLLDVVSHTPVEIELLGAAKAAFDWIDVTREFVPMNEKIYSWWSYRAQDWEASNRGRRLDHIWVSPGLKGAVSNHAILKETRGWTQTSDHVPVLATLEV
jgi:exodeoxyribonuclease-3